MKKCWVWLVMVAVTSVAVGSCANTAQELSTYWDGYDFTSLDGFDDIEMAEDKFEGYIELVEDVPFEIAERSLRVFLDSAARNEVAYMVWATWFETYLHALDSPYCNDRLFSVWLNKAIDDKVLDDYTLERLCKIRNVIGLNVAGQPAADVVLKDADGVEFQISDLKGQKTLLMLLDADCPSCLDYLEDNLAEYDKKDVRLLAVLVNGSPAHIRNISTRLSEDIIDNWILSWCPGREVERGEVYDLTLIPSRIMLDKHNIVEKSYY